MHLFNGIEFHFYGHAIWIVGRWSTPSIMKLFAWITTTGKVTTTHMNYAHTILFTFVSQYYFKILKLLHRPIFISHCTTKRNFVLNVPSASIAACLFMINLDFVTAKIKAKRLQFQKQNLRDVKKSITSRSMVVYLNLLLNISHSLSQNTSVLY